MRANQRKQEPPQFLSGWKDIANYLGKGVRTVQRYERELGFPVRRPAGKPWGSVVATKAEIDAWVAASPIREAFHLSKQTSNSGENVFASLDRGTTEMLRLRNQMQALRLELRSSLQALRTTVVGLQMGLRATSQHVSHPDTEYDSEIKKSSNLLRIDMGRQKAN